MTIRCPWHSLPRPITNHILYLRHRRYNLPFVLGAPKGRSVCLPDRAGFRFRSAIEPRYPVYIYVYRRPVTWIVLKEGLPRVRSRAGLDPPTRLFTRPLALLSRQLRCRLAIHIHIGKINRFIIVARHPHHANGQALPGTSQLVIWRCSRPHVLLLTPAGTPSSRHTPVLRELNAPRKVPAPIGILRYVTYGAIALVRAREPSALLPPQNAQLIPPMA